MTETAPTPYSEARRIASFMPMGEMTMPWPPSPSMTQVALLSCTIFQSGVGLMSPSCSCLT